MEKENNINMDSLAEKREVYKAPVIEMVEVRVEQGFQITTSPESERSAEEYTW